MVKRLKSSGKKKVQKYFLGKSDIAGCVMESDKIICVMKICSMERFTVYGKKARRLKY